MVIFLDFNTGSQIENKERAKWHKFFSINMSDEPIFFLLSKAASQLLFNVLAKLSTQVQVYGIKPLIFACWIVGAKNNFFCKIIRNYAKIANESWGQCYHYYKDSQIYFCMLKIIRKKFPTTNSWICISQTIFTGMGESVS